MDPRLTVLILTHDNEDTLGAVLDSVAFADEILVVDSGSRDGTLRLAESKGARILSHPFTDFASQRNAGWAAARGNWILALDSDEVLDETAGQSVRSAVARDAEPGGAAAFQIRIQNYFLGKPLKGGGLDRDYHTRLALRRASRWEGAIHERILIDGEISHLPGTIHHYTGRSLAQRIEKLVRYASARAEEMRRLGERSSPARAIQGALRLFCGRYFLRRGFRDGIHGLIWWWLIATEILLAHGLLLLSNTVIETGREETGPRG
jgi:glycosyltransferase involved in cell wall biosynthesis